jgi:hypothetical protein
VARVDCTFVGVVRVSEDSLHDKDARDCFRASVVRGEGQVYVSDISLNEQLGAIALPELPAMRFGAGVHRPDCMLSGVVVRTFDARWMLDDFCEITPQQGELVIAKSAGACILHPNAEFTFGVRRRRFFRRAGASGRRRGRGGVDDCAQRGCAAAATHGAADRAGENRAGRVGRAAHPDRGGDGGDNPPRG